MPSARPHIEKHFTAGNFVRDVVARADLRPRSWS